MKRRKQFWIFSRWHSISLLLPRPLNRMFVEYSATFNLNYFGLHKNYILIPLFLNFQQGFDDFCPPPILKRASLSKIISSVIFMMIIIIDIVAIWFRFGWCAVMFTCFNCTCKCVRERVCGEGEEGERILSWIDKCVYYFFVVVAVKNYCFRWWNTSYGSWDGCVNVVVAAATAACYRNFSCCLQLDQFQFSYCAA